MSTNYEEYLFIIFSVYTVVPQRCAFVCALERASFRGWGGVWGCNVLVASSAPPHCPRRLIDRAALRCSTSIYLLLKIWRRGAVRGRRPLLATPRKQLTECSAGNWSPYYLRSETACPRDPTTSRLRECPSFARHYF